MHLPRGLDQLTNLHLLPILRPDTQVHYEGSIDKRGGNADWDWWLYQDNASGEWVLCEAQGPGCLWNFVVHHAVGHSDPIYRFYINGSTTPAFQIRHSEFGRKHPFVAPLADAFRPAVAVDERLQTIDFRIVRSFCPMPFTRSLRITSSVKLEGNEKTGGGWGHAIWHSYASPQGIPPFTGQEDYEPLLRLWQSSGHDLPAPAGTVVAPVEADLSPGATTRLFQQDSAGCLNGISLQMATSHGAASKEWRAKAWVRMYCDGESEPAVDCPLGAFFGNELGHHRIGTLMQGARADGTYYCNWPMPFRDDALVELHLDRDAEAALHVQGEIRCAPLDLPEPFGHFRTSTYQPLQHKQPGRDSPIAEIVGHGHIVAGTITGIDSKCEGDVRVHIDGCRTPAVESDGSESWVCYGWGFAFPPQADPVSCYDGSRPDEWSMLRTLPGGFYPFRTGLRLTVEGGGGDKRGTDRRSGILFWYGDSDPAMVLTDTVDIGDPASEAEHRYRAPASRPWTLTSSFEGEFDDVPHRDSGRTLRHGSEFTVHIDPRNKGVLLRRCADQAEPAQRAHMMVDGKHVHDRDWIAPDHNPHFRWREDEFLVPAIHTHNKSVLRIEIRPPDDAPLMNWNESRYDVFSLV